MRICRLRTRGGAEAVMLVLGAAADADGASLARPPLPFWCAVGLVGGGRFPNRPGTGTNPWPGGLKTPL